MIEPRCESRPEKRPSKAPTRWSRWSSCWGVFERHIRPHFRREPEPPLRAAEGFHGLPDVRVNVGGGTEREQLPVKVKTDTYLAFADSGQSVESVGAIGVTCIRDFPYEGSPRVSARQR